MTVNTNTFATFLCMCLTLSFCIFIFFFVTGGNRFPQFSFPDL